MESKKAGWWARNFRRPNNVDEAIKGSDELGETFILLGAIHLALGVFLGAYTALDGAIFMGLGWALKRYRSRGVAVVITIISLIGVFATGQNKFSGGNGGRNIMLAVIVAVCGFQACRVTFIYHKLVGSRLNFINSVVKSFLAIAYSGLALIVTVIIGMIFGMNFDNTSDMERAAGVLVLASAAGAAFAGLLPFTRNRPVTSLPG